MKKTFLLIIVLTILFPFNISALENDLTKGAKSAVMIDYDTGNILYEKNKDEKRSVASLTKLMGLLIAFEKIEDKSLDINEVLVTSKTAKEMGGTQIWLEEGEKISVNDLLKGITLASANDAMVLLAERISGSEEAFVNLMNKKAKELGLKNTYFKNCTGFDEEGAYSSAYDIAIISKNLLKHEKILNYTSKYEDYIRENTDNKTWIVNTNKLVKFYKGVDGLKTGYEEKAGSTIAVTAINNNLRLILVTLGYPNAKDRNNEAMKLLDYGFNQYESIILIKKNKIIKKINLPKAKNKISLRPKDDIKVTIKKGDKVKDYSYSIKINKINLPLKKGAIVGTLCLKDQEKCIKKYPLIVNKDIKKASFLKQYLQVITTSLKGI